MQVPRHLLLAALLASGLAPPPARAQELPARNQALLLLRVLAYDRNLATRAGREVVVLVLYKAGDRASEERREALVAAFEAVAHDVVVAGLPVRVKAAPYRDAAELELRLEAVRAALVHVDSALQKVVPEIAAVTHRKGVLSGASGRSLVEAGLAVAVVPSGSRAGIVVNLGGSRAERADLDAALLAVAEVLKE
jgi:hypothetical protein